MRRTKRMKLPNGFGQISELKGNLRKPFRAMVTVGHTPEGRPICRLLKPVSYFKTYNEAYYALMEYNRDPYDWSKDLTLQRVYDQWSEWHFKSISQSLQKQYENSMSKLGDLRDMRIQNIRAMHIRKAVESIEGVYSQKTKILLNMLFDYAEENEMVKKNYARIAKIKFDHTTKHHITFTDEEIKTLWDDSSNYWTKYLLIQCYTGLRPGELVDLKTENINLEEDYLIGGKKTKAGTDRRIPIHPAIKSLIEEKLNCFPENPSGKFLRNENGAPIQAERYRIQFKNIIQRLGLDPEHKAHDPRKFFISQAKKYQLDEYAIKLIVGHAIEDITESTYTVRTPEWLYSEICKIVV